MNYWKNLIGRYVNPSLEELLLPISTHTISVKRKLLKKFENKSNLIKTCAFIDRKWDEVNVTPKWFSRNRLSLSIALTSEIALKGKAWL